MIGEWRKHPDGLELQHSGEVVRLSFLTSNYPKVELFIKRTIVVGGYGLTSEIITTHDSLTDALAGLDDAVWSARQRHHVARSAWDATEPFTETER